MTRGRWGKQERLEDNGKLKRWYKKITARQRWWRMRQSRTTAVGKGLRRWEEQQ